MSMLTRAGTMVRKPRRSSASRAVPRRRSAPTVLQGRSQSSKSGQHRQVMRISSSPHNVLRSSPNSPARSLTRSPQDSPAKSVTFFPRDLSPKHALEFSFKCSSDISQDSSTGLEGVVISNKHGTCSPADNSPAKSVSFFLDLPSSTEIITAHHKESCVVQLTNTSPLEKQFYESTVIWPGVEECEQHYSLMSSVCEACVDSAGICEFFYRAFTIISTTWPVTVLLVLLLALPLVMTTIGVNYLHDCPKEPKLPIYQVVGGVFGIIKVLFLLWKQVKKHKDDVGDIHDEDDLSTMIRMTNIALNIFLTIWFAFGHYWLFSIWKPQFHAPLHEPTNWCDRTVFLFTFWQMVICHTIIACLLVLVIILFYCYFCVKCVLDENKS